MEGKAKKGCDIKDKVKSLETNFEATLKLSLRVRGNTRQNRKRSDKRILQGDRYRVDLFAFVVDRRHFKQDLEDIFYAALDNYLYRVR